MEHILSSVFLLFVIFGHLLGSVHILRNAKFRPLEFFLALRLPFPICSATLATVGFFAHSILHGLLGALIIFKLQATQAFLMLFFLWLLINALDMHWATQMFNDDMSPKRDRSRHPIKHVFVFQLVKFIIAFSFTGLLYQTAPGLSHFLSFYFLYNLWVLFATGWLLFLCLSRRGRD